MSTAEAIAAPERERGQLEELRRLLPYAKKHRGLLAITLVTSVLLAVIDIPIPFFLRRIIDELLKHHERASLFGRMWEPEQFLFGVFGSLVFLALLKGLLLYSQRTISETIGQRIVFELRLDLFRHLQSLSMQFFRSARTGKLMLRLIGDINAVLDMITDGFLRALIDITTILAVTIVIFALNWKLAAIVSVGLPLYVYTFLRLNPKLRESGRLARNERSALSGNLQEKISGAAVVKAFAQEGAEQDRVEEQTGRLRDRLIDKARVGGRLTALAHITAALGGALVLWVGGLEVLSGAMSKGSLMAFYSLAAMLFPPLRRMAKTNETYQAARVSLDRILDFFDDTEALQEKENGASLVVTRGEVRFEQVSFEYVEGAPVLSEIDLEVHGGEVIALVGANGAGKTTLINHLLRFLSPTSGRVEIDGQDLAQVSLSSLRKQIGVVTQETLLFSGSIADNIRYGRPDAGDEEVRAAARLAGADEFIQAMRDGYDTDVAERGRRLSGGQMQKIALARAILLDPPILVLDEATSAVDAEAEAQIQEAMAGAMRGRTTFVIAHRISTVLHADRIVVLERGRIVEQGKHHELWSRRGVYTRLFAEQLLTSAQQSSGRSQGWSDQR